MAIQAVNVNNNGSIPLPEGLSKYSVFATNEIHPLANEQIYMLKHPCFAFQALEKIAAAAFTKHTNALKERFGLESIEHVIKSRDETGELITSILPNNFIGTYWGLSSVIMGTSLAQNFKLLRPNDPYPIGYTELNLPIVAFSRHVPVLTNNNHFTELAHLLNYTIDQEVKRHFVYSLFPFIDQRDVVAPTINLTKDGKLEQILLSLIQKKGFSNVQLMWADKVEQFSKVIRASISNDEDFFLDVKNPIYNVLDNLTTQPDSMSFGKAVSLSNSQAHRPIQLTIVPENQIQLFLMPQLPTADRKVLEQQKLEEERMKKAFEEDMGSVATLTENLWNNAGV